MNKALLLLLIVTTYLFGDLTHEYPSKKMLDSKIPIVDIRTPAEWVETGIVKDSINIMFWDERGSHNVEAFLTELNKKVNTKKPFAIICRTGSRTRLVADYLVKELNYDVVNILGGIVYFKAMKLKTVPYGKQ